MTTNTTKIQVKNLAKMLDAKGNPNKNQLLLNSKEGVYFQSYNTIIAFKGFSGEVELDYKYFNFSRTTIIYCNKFLNEKSGDILKKVQNGTYKLINLNKHI